jgi:threonine/homoserine/homoserine lactone efflux protein
MPDLAHLSLFLVAAIALLLTPGPAVFYIMGRSIEQGRRAGLVSVLSVEVGNFAHVLAATFGLSALLLSSALAFTLVKYLGAAYLIYLGLRTLLRPGDAPATNSMPRQSLRRIFAQGVLVATLNPKTALFFVAFLPQFVDPSRGNVTNQLFALGSIFVLLGTVSDSLYAMLAGTLGQWLKGTSAFRRAERYVVGSVYLGLGAAATMTDARRR